MIDVPDQDHYTMMSVVGFHILGVDFDANDVFFVFALANILGMCVNQVAHYYKSTSVGPFLKDIASIIKHNGLLNAIGNDGRLITQAIAYDLNAPGGIGHIPPEFHVPTLTSLLGDLLNDLTHYAANTYTDEETRIVTRELQHSHREYPIIIVYECNFLPIVISKVLA